MRFASYFAGILVCVTASTALAAEAPDSKPRPLSPPPGASVPVGGDQQRFAKNELGQVLALRDIADPANPYAGKYSDSDRWYFEHYVAAVTPEEEKHFGG